MSRGTWRRRRRRGSRSISTPRALTKHVGKHYLYKVTVGGMVYYGYSSRTPSVRVAEHIRDCKKGVNTKFYNVLRKNDYRLDFETVGVFDDEFAALVREIELIDKHKPYLNTSSGGEGRTMIVEVVTLPDGTKQYNRRSR